MKINYINYILVLFFLFACQKRKESNHFNDIKLEAYNYIDQNNEDRALDFLSIEIEKYEQIKDLSLSEKNEVKELKMIFASVLVKKAGLSLGVFYNSAQIIKKIDEINKSIDSLLKDKAVINDQKQAKNIFKGFFDVLKVIYALPKLQTEKIKFIEQAFKIIDNLESLSSDQILYSSLIKIIYARNLMITGIVDESKSGQFNRERCQIDLIAFHENFKLSIKYMIDSLKQISLVKSKEKEKLDKQVLVLKNIQQLTTNFIQFKILLDDTKISLLQSLKLYLGVTNLLDQCYE